MECQTITQALLCKQALPVAYGTVSLTYSSLLHLHIRACTVESCHNTVTSSKNTYCQWVQPWGWSLASLLWIFSIICVSSLSFLRSMEHCVFVLWNSIRTISIMSYQPKNYMKKIRIYHTRHNYFFFLDKSAHGELNETHDYFYRKLVDFAQDKIILNIWTNWYSHVNEWKPDVTIKQRRATSELTIIYQ